MPWCHNCKTEYREGFKECSDCGAALYNSPPPLEEKPAPDEPRAYSGESFLITTADQLETEVVISKLRAADIPCLQRDRETGAYMKVILGSSVYGTDLYVPTDMLEDAKILIERVTFTEEDIEEILKMEEPKVETSPTSNPYVSIGIVVAIIIVIVLLWLK